MKKILATALALLLAASLFACGTPATPSPSPSPSVSVSVAPSSAAPWHFRGAVGVSRRKPKRRKAGGRFL